MVTGCPTLTRKGPGLFKQGMAALAVRHVGDRFVDDADVVAAVVGERHTALQDTLHFDVALGAGHSRERMLVASGATGRRHNIEPCRVGYGGPLRPVLKGDRALCKEKGEHARHSARPAQAMNRGSTSGAAGHGPTQRLLISAQPSEIYGIFRSKAILHHR